MNVKYIFFDMGYTLVDETEVWKKRCEEQAEKEEAKKLNIKASDLLDLISKASSLYKEQFRYVMNELNIRDIVPYNPSLETLYKDTIDTLKYLSKKYSLGIIANQIEGLNERLVNLKIDKYFKVVISSSDYKLYKPDLNIFKLGLKMFNADPKETLYVGDRLDNDIYPAKKLGMKTIQIKKGFAIVQKPKNKDFEPDLVINNLNELIDIL